MPHTYGLVGFPLGHSFSAGYFAEKFAAAGLDRTDYRYLNFEVASVDELRKVLPPDICGFNVTIPHKQAILPLLAEIDPQAQAVGAVNCVRVEADGRWTGYNTDVDGFERSLCRMLATETIPAALVLGTGGASRAVAHVLEKLGIDITFVSRSGGNGRLAYEEVMPEIIVANRLIINTTPLGMFPHGDTLPEIPYPALTSAHYLHDLVYHPAETAFLHAGRRHGARVKNGLEMLVCQAERSWEIWNNPL